MKTCDDCFTALPLPVQETINGALAAQDDISLAQFGIQYTIPASVNNIAQLCIQLNTENIEITNAQISGLAQEFVNLGVGGIDIATILVNCLIEAGVVDVRTPE